MNMTYEKQIQTLNNAMLSLQKSVVLLNDLPGIEFVADINKILSIQDHVQNKLEFLLNKK
jgi:hypothetical protein